ncbi:DUF2188 domain-containing protein [Acuticoccus sp. MNP-M23]|uniref:DUF2188 domain-containing protein n=1 Tax=Acuticoccus sp. MNP-M23 TaxID=3072793 RepID=UPI002815E68D|nr:DUF2188 domain-containing protein [Acuticoccus sp. MNP-M23]WMS43671.1 DUF2188 domain-containing protein [Acuticoccus sp. MNP-M23]
MAANEKNYWTQQRDDSRWETLKEGAERASKVFDTQAESWAYTKEMAQKSMGEAFLKGMDGKIRERNTYGNDPVSSKG